MRKNIAVLPGDGIGPEIIRQALKVLDAVAERSGLDFEYETVPVGGCCIDEYGVPITEDGLKLCLASDSVLLGAVGGPKWDGLPAAIRPEKALLGLRKELELFANLRPVRLYPQLAGASPLSAAVLRGGIDLVIVRELTGGIYFGRRGTQEVDGEQVAFDEMKYSEHEIRRIGKIAFDSARMRRGKVASVDKANVLDTSRLWRRVMHEMARDYPDVAYEDVLVDNAAMQLIRDPSQFDVVVTENMFGDILSDEAGMLTGSIGMMPSASLSESKRGMYEPIHGSAPEIAGKDVANPIGTILSVAMMLRYAFDLKAEADRVNLAVDAVLDRGCRTADIMSDGCIHVGCDEMGDLITQEIKEMN